LARSGFSQTISNKGPLSSFSIVGGGFSINICSAFYLIWLSCVWTIWRDRNAKVFQQKGNSIIQIKLSSKHSGG